MQHPNPDTNNVTLFRGNEAAVREISNQCGGKFRLVPDKGYFVGVGQIALEANQTARPVYQIHHYHKDDFLITVTRSLITVSGFEYQTTDYI